MNLYCNSKILLQTGNPIKTNKNKPQYETAVCSNLVIHLQRCFDFMADGRGERQQHSAHWSLHWANCVCLCVSPRLKQLRVIQCVSYGRWLAGSMLYDESSSCWVYWSFIFLNTADRLFVSACVNGDVVQEFMQTLIDGWYRRSAHWCVL